MADGGVTYSRVVAFLKVLLPLSALALLSTLFLISRNVGGTSSSAIPFAQVDLEQRAREQQITAPFFSGRTSGGHLVSFRAETARPDPEDAEKSEASKVDAQFDFSDGSVLTLSSDQAAINNANNTAILRGEVEIRSSNGYEMRTQLLEASMRELRASSPGTVIGTGPAGDFEAGSLLIEPTDNPDEVTLLFTNGVKLIYTPSN